MKPIQTSLLFLGTPTLALEHFCETLAKRLTTLNIPVEDLGAKDGDLITCRAGDSTISIVTGSSPLAADQFIGAMDSPLSKPVIGLLSDTLKRHTRHMTVSVSATANQDEDPAGFLTRLQITHATTALLVEWHIPAAVHWKQSNQLLSGAQYLQLTTDACPWALFARARVTSYGEPDQMVRNHGVCLEEAVEFIGRPIEFRASALPLDESHAAALSFLRHHAETGAPIPDGDTFGPRNGPVFTVRHIDPSDDLPHGMYELSLVPTGADLAPSPAPQAPKPTHQNAERPATVPPELHGFAAPHPRERTRSMAISYLMLVIMPPVGAILLMSNAIFGSNVFRTGVVAVASLALAVVVGTYTFINQGHDTAFLLENDLIRSVILAD